MQRFCIGFLFLFVAAAAAIGQTSPGDIVVDVPFEFSAGGQSLPAGHYVVAAHDDLIRIFNASTRGIYVSTHAAARSKAGGSKVVFHRYGNSYFMASVWVTGSNFGKELFRSKSEREMQAHQSEMELAVVRAAQP